MYVEDLKKDFYNVLCGNRVLLLVHLDVDAVCACKILQSLFRTDNIPHTLVAVGGPSELNAAYGEHCEDIRYVVLLNCGGTLDLVELLQPAEEVVFFVLDSHRPTDVCNVYSNGQVRLVGRPEGEDVPKFDDIFRDDDEEDEEDRVEDSDEGTSRVERVQQRAEQNRTRRRERLTWEQNRDTLMFHYTQFSHFGRAVAVRIMEVAWTLSKDSREVLWWAVVGATEQLVLEKTELAQYLLEAGALQAHAARLEHALGGDASVSVVLERDARLALYRHWSLEEALRHSALSWASLRLWGARGAVRLQRLLADMGLPLREARQPFASMELDLRRELLPALERLADKYGLRDLLYPAFCVRSGYGTRLCAADAVYALLGLLEGPQGFQRALLALSLTEGSEELRRGLETSKLRLLAAGNAVQSALRGHRLQSAGPFLHLLLPEEGPGGPRWLGLVARWLQRGAPGGGRPLLLAAPGLEGRTILLGVPPLTEDSTRNLFGKAFEQAALRSQSDVSPDWFDSATISIQSDHLNKFLDALTTLLT